jgi:hypothetical protein
MADPNPFDQAVADIFSGQMALGVRASVAQVADRNPDSEAELQRKARVLGVPADSARPNADVIDKRVAAKAVDYDNLARTAPRTSRFLSTTSNAAIAHDDIGVLGMIEKGLRSFANPASLVTDLFPGLAQHEATRFSGEARSQGGTMLYLRRVLHTSVTDPAKKGLGNLVSGALGALEGSQETAEKFDVTAGLQRRLFGGTMESGLASLSRAARRKIDQSVSYQPADTQLGRDIQMGIESVPTTLAALAATLATGGTATGLGLIGATTYGQSYGQARDEGEGVGRASLKSFIDAAVEIGTEYLPEKYFLKDANAGKSLGKMLLDQIKTEMPGEQAATLLQDFNQWAMIDANKGKGFDQYLGEILPHATSTLIATGVGMGALYGVGKVPSTALRVVERLSGSKRQPLPDDDPQRAAARGEAQAEYASALKTLLTLRRSSDGQTVMQQLQALADEHLQKKLPLEEQHTQALADLASAKDLYQQAQENEAEARKKASLSRTQARFSPETFKTSDADAAEQAHVQAEEGTKAAREEVARASLAASRAAVALQAHAYVEQQIQSHLHGRNHELIDAERRALNVARRLAQKAGDAQGGFAAAQQIEDLSRLAEASKLRERNAGPGPGSFHDLIDEMADGSALETVYVNPAALVAATLAGE